MADERWGSRDFGIARGKSEHHTATCRVKYAGAAVPQPRDCGDGKCHRKDTAGSLATMGNCRGSCQLPALGQARVKRRGKSSPLAEQFARHEKPHAVQDKTEG